MKAAEATPISTANSTPQILAFAEKTRVAALGRPYKFGGTTLSGFDCSGFVVYVFDKIFGAGNPPRITAEGLYRSHLFKPITGKPQPGDLIFFSDDGRTASHVAIMANNNQFIGSQSSTGVAYVHLNNPYWRPKILGYRRWAGPPSKRPPP